MKHHHNFKQSFCQQFASGVKTAFRHTKESFEFLGPNIPKQPPPKTTPTFIRVPFDARRRLKTEHCHQKYHEHERMMQFVCNRMHQTFDTHAPRHYGGFGGASHYHRHHWRGRRWSRRFREFKELRKRNIEAYEAALKEYTATYRKSQPLLVLKLAQFPCYNSSSSTSALNSNNNKKFFRYLPAQKPPFIKGFASQSLLSSQLSSRINNFGIRSLGLANIPQVREYSTHSVCFIYTLYCLSLQPKIESAEKLLHRSYASLSTSSLLQTASQTLNSLPSSPASVNTSCAPTLFDQDISQSQRQVQELQIPRTGSYVQFDMAPKFSLPEVSSLSEDILDTLTSELDSFAQKIRNLSQDLKNLSGLGHLPISIEENSNLLNVYFGNCEPERLGGLLCDVEVSQGTIRSQESDYVGKIDRALDYYQNGEEQISAAAAAASSSSSSSSHSSRMEYTSASELELMQFEKEVRETSRGVNSMTSVPSLTNASSGDTVSEVSSGLF